ncbi:condensation domain-containing protein, partial [Trinickia caryophylli]
MGAPNTVAFSDLTGPQLEMWFAQQVEPDNPLFDSRAYVDIQGEIDIETFFQAVRRFVDEADVLHLRFTETAAGPVQYLDTTRACAVAFVDVSERADPDAAAWQMMQEASSSLFNLIAGPTFTQQLFKLGHAHYIWYQRYHHIAMDGASVPIAIRRVMQIYGALTSGQAVPLAEFGGLDTMLQSDQAYRRSARHEVDRLYWLDYVARLPWPQTVCGAPAEGSGAFNRASAPLPPALAGRLAASGENASRWPQLLTAIVAAYLFRVSDSRVTVFDFPVAARPKEARAMPGMFANVLPLQLHLSPRSTVAELSRQVGAEVFKHVKHQQFRGKDIKQMRGLEAGPIFGPRINIIPFEDEWDFAGSPATSHSLANGLVHDLAITVIGTPGKAGCMLHVDGNATLYDARALDAHKQRLLHFIDTALAAPERPIEEIELVDAEER